MSGASVPYHLRQNKHVERRLFVDLLAHLDRWQPLKKYLYVGFGAIYFEDFKLLHSHFANQKMLSIERDAWVLPRQERNVPYGCIDHEHCMSSEFIQNLDKYRRKYKAKNILAWLDYAGGLEISAQLNDVKALIPGLLENDVLKVTFEADPSKLQGPGTTDDDKFVARFEEAKRRLGSQFLPEGISPQQMTDEKYPIILCEAFRRVVAQSMKESPNLIFQPIGSYVYRDSLQMITITGIVLGRDKTEEFLEITKLEDFELAGLRWQLQPIDVPILSLREKFILDKEIFDQTAVQVQKKIGFAFAEDPDESVKMIENYMKFYRYYPNYYPVVV